MGKQGGTQYLVIEIGHVRVPRRNLSEEVRTHVGSSLEL